VVATEGLTATEVAQLTAQLQNTKFPTKVSAIAQADTTVTNETLYAGYNMKPVSNKIIDQSGNGFDGVITGATYEKDKVMGDTLRFDGVNDNINLGSAIFSTSDANHTFTVMAWVYSDDYSQDDWVFTQYNAGAYRWTWGFESNTIRYFWNGTSKFSTGNLVNGTWNHIATSKDSSGNIKFYINGVHQGTEVLNGYFENVNTFMGSGANGVNWYAGLINSPKILKNVILSEDEILAEYNKVKNTGVSFKTDWGVKESVAIEGGVEDKQLSNSPFNFSTTTGRFKIISEDDIKAIACTTSGFIYHKVDCSEKEAAYGTWEFSVRGGTGSATTLYFISDTKTIAGGVSTYYAISYYGDDEYFKVTSYDTTTTSTKLNTGGHSYPKDTIHKVRITRDAAGIFHIYINGSLAAVSSGANTWTDNTVAITGKYMVVGQNASNNELFLSDKTGGNSIIKRNLA